MWFGKKRTGEFIRRGDMANQSRRWAEAESAYRNALELDSELPRTWVQYGHALKEQGKLHEAEQAYWRSISLNPMEADSFLQLGHVLKLESRIEEAKLAYATSRARDPARIDAAEELARLETANPARIDAAEELARLETADPARIDAAEELARLETADPARIDAAEELARLETAAQLSFHAPRDVAGEGLTQSGIYNAWVARDQARLEEERPLLTEHIEHMLYKPTFLILIETHTDGVISETLISLEKQIYPHWRVHLVHSDKWADAKDLPEGEFLVPIRAGDILSPEALYEFANSLNIFADQDLIYADEDRILVAGDRGQPFYKPEWSPDYLETFNYIGYAACFRRDLAERCLSHEGYYGFILRFSEQTTQISHIRKVLCHRSYQSSRRTAAEETLEACALAMRLQRTGRTGEVLPIGNRPLAWEVRVRPRRNPLVSIVIPTAGKVVSHEGRELDLVVNCVSQICERSTYRNFEIILVDNDDINLARKRCLDQIGSKFVTYRNPIFNVARKLNLGASEAKGEFLLLLNDDIEIITPEWIERMLGHFEKGHVGVVGVKLLYPNGQIQHAGVVHSHGNPDHVRRGFSRYDRGYFFSTCGVRNYAAVTGACMMVRKEIYWSVSGYTEELVVNFNDIDFCQKVRAMGLSIVYTPHVELIHYESQSIKKGFVDQREVKFYHERWAPKLTIDPFYNEQHLSIGPATFEVVINRKFL
jgi:glycosyltransferase involved in cell wall biosynthesis/tetratricopeptide (TPR) repeat protein